eukprot:3941003-Rhodomonas_salina.2
MRGARAIARVPRRTVARVCRRVRIIATRAVVLARHTRGFVPVFACTGAEARQTYAVVPVLRPGLRRRHPVAAPLPLAERIPVAKGALYARLAHAVVCRQTLEPSFAHARVQRSQRRPTPLCKH